MAGLLFLSTENHDQSDITITVQLISISSSWEKMQTITPLHVNCVINSNSTTNLRDDFINSLHETDGWVILVQIWGQKVDPDNVTANKWTIRIHPPVSLHGVLIFLQGFGKFGKIMIYYRNIGLMQTPRSCSESPWVRESSTIGTYLPIPNPPLAGKANHFVSVPGVIKPCTGELECVGFPVRGPRLETEEPISFKPVCLR